MRVARPRMWLLGVVVLVSPALCAPPMPGPHDPLPPIPGRPAPDPQRRADYKFISKLKDELKRSNEDYKEREAGGAGGNRVEGDGRRRAGDKDRKRRFMTEQWGKHEHHPLSELLGESLKEGLGRDLDTTTQDTTLPPAEQLDMIPAKGGRVYSMRLKRRLCNRHVLLPEGPKYDSRGGVYVREHPDHAGPFHLTKAPDLLLPRCCNCCRKSVLGCE